MKVAFIFNGQGSQYVGMGKDFYLEFPFAKEMYDKFPDVRDIAFENEELINQTKYAQPTMLLTSYVFAKMLESNNIKPEYVCGLSLGEYSALAYADTWKIEDAIDIIKYRGDIMQNALPLGTTAMAAVIGLDKETLLEEIKKIEGTVEVANYNCPGQIVITGDTLGIDNAIKQLEGKAMKVVKLNVSGAFHSSFLVPASKKLRAKLDEYKPQTPKYKVIYNISGKEENKPLNEILEKQICSSVYFEDSLRYLIDKGVDTFVEIGPGKSLSGFLKRIDRKILCYTINDLNSFKQVIEKFN
ncbi:MAG: ACP S-malonyltransferase [Acholeplasmatales bacterium]|nr:ACP S-malonyltransferase [Acholeplasmatales bacterium]